MSIKENLLFCLAWLLLPVLFMVLYKCVSIFVDVLIDTIRDELEIKE